LDSAGAQPACGKTKDPQITQITQISFLGIVKPIALRFVRRENLRNLSNLRILDFSEGGAPSKEKK
jgi:hypothetical protein